MLSHNDEFVVFLDLFCFLEEYKGGVPNDGVFDRQRRCMALKVGSKAFIRALVEGGYKIGLHSPVIQFTQYVLAEFLELPPQAIAHVLTDKLSVSYSQDAVLHPDDARRKNYVIGQREVYGKGFTNFVIVTSRFQPLGDRMIVYGDDTLAKIQELAALPAAKLDKEEEELSI
jgi:hypothetical protein